MIRSFQHKGLKQLYTKGSTKGIPVQMSGKIRRVLDAIAVAESPGDLMVPGFSTHQLKGDRKGTWAVGISRNWRVTFQFNGIHATGANLEDYH